MYSEKLPPIHPGEILNEEFLIPLGISKDKLADSIDVTAERIHAIIRGDKSINAEIALLLSRYFDTSARFWTGLQSRYDLDIANDLIEAKLNSIKPRPMNGIASDGELELPKQGKCKCGCGITPGNGSAFSQGHDQKALHKVIKSEYGSVLEFLQHHGYASNR